MNLDITVAHMLKSKLLSMVVVIANDNYLSISKRMPGTKYVCYRCGEVKTCRTERFQKLVEGTANCACESSAVLSKRMWDEGQVRRVTLCGLEISIKELAFLAGMSTSSARACLKHGETPEQIASTNRPRRSHPDINRKVTYTFLVSQPL